MPTVVMALFPQLRHLMRKIKNVFSEMPTLVGTAKFAYSYTVNGDECVIQHKRSGAGCLSLFLGVLLMAWGAFWLDKIRGYLNRGSGDLFELCYITSFGIPWFSTVVLLLYVNFNRKTFRFSTDFLSIETKLFSVRWHHIRLRRDSILEIKQVKDGGGKSDSFPSWGLQIKAAAVSDSWLQRLVLMFNFGRHTRYRTILWKLPYAQSKWLAEVLGNWTGITPQLCREEDATIQIGSS